MFKMTYDITIGDYKIPYISEVTVTTSVDNLADTATVMIPATAFKRRLMQTEWVEVGKHITIKLGYDGNNNTEFDGWVRSKTDKDGGMLIECEDNMYMFRQATLTDKEYVNPSADTLIRLCIDAVNKSTNVQWEAWGDQLTFKNEMKFKYDKFVVRNASAYDVMRKLLDETKADVWWYGLTMYICPRYLNQSTAEVSYEFQTNIEKSGLSLTWRNKDDRKLLVEVKGKNGRGKDKTEVIATAGEAGGDRVTETIHGVTDYDSLQEIADGIYARKSFTGFDGSFQAWLTPFTKASDIVSLRDKEDTSRNGKYYVMSTEVSFGPNGGIRKVKLGNRIA